MKVVQINTGPKGSTGNIMNSIATVLRENGEEAYTFSAPKKEMPPVGHQYFGSKIENLFHRGFSCLSGISGKGSSLATKKLLRTLDTIKPDVLHLHNLHGWYINLPMLFSYIKKNKINVVWTLHDCWGFTAQCSHFTMEKCSKWKSGCHDCPRYRIYPYTYVDRTKTMWKLKKKWFTGVENMTIVTPSSWLAELVKQSYLGQYPVLVINNGINLDVFRPVESDYKLRNGLPDKFVVLGVASEWTDRKGLDVFITLAKMLPQEYKVVLVGTNEDIDKRLPMEILSIHRTQNQHELAEIYTMADVFVNPTREETFPTVNIEALACGTPIVTFDTGGSPEIINEKTGIIVACDDYEGLTTAIQEFCEKGTAIESVCCQRAQEFSAQVKFEEYYALYKKLLA